MFVVIANGEMSHNTDEFTILWYTKSTIKLNTFFKLLILSNLTPDGSRPGRKLQGLADAANLSSFASLRVLLQPLANGVRVKLQWPPHSQKSSEWSHIIAHPLQHLLTTPNNCARSVLTTKCTHILESLFGSFTSGLVREGTA
jgi:hypothetical protein